MQYFSKLLPTISWPTRVALLLLLVLGLPFLAAGQEATVVGTVTDPTGGVVPNVTITITNVQTNAIRTLTTNDAGQYVASNLPIGKYDVKAEAAGFKLETQTGVMLNVNDRIRVDFQMKVGAKTETVSVEANALAVQSDSSEVSSLVNGTQITELATNGRTIYSYVTLTPGASNLNGDTQIPVPVGGASGNISFNGNRNGHNLYLLDGGENSDRGGAGSSSVMPSIDAIAETQTLTSNYSADYGLSSGGTISSAIKSGTQTIHASAWEFFRNDALDARNFFNPPPAKVGELRYNIFGFNVGGPVTFGKLYNPDKKKTFFFFNMEWRKFINGNVINQQVPVHDQVPGHDAYAGDFTGAVPADFKVDKSVDASTPAIPFSGLHAPCKNQLTSTQQAMFTIAGQAFSQPTASGSCAVNTKATVANNPTFVPFNGNTLPFLNAFAQTLLSDPSLKNKYGLGIFPLPNNGNRFTLPAPVPTDVREEIVRIDHNFTDKFSVYGHFVDESVNQNLATSMWSGDNVPTVGNTFGNPSYAGVFHATYSISPTLVNEASFNYNGNRIHIHPTGTFTAPAGSYSRFFNVSGQNSDNRIPSINLSQATGSQYTVNWMPWDNLADSYQLRDDVSWTKGRHQFKMGGSWLLYKKVQDWFKNTQGNFTFDGSFTGNDFADYLLGYGQNYTEDAFKSAGHWNNVSWALYFQDNWRVNNKLTLNLGLRWDGIPHTYEANNQMANFYPNLSQLSDAAVLTSNGNTVCNGPFDPATGANPGCTAASPGLGPSPNIPGQQFYVNGIGVCGVNGVPKGCVSDSWLNFQPRLGFAYDLKGNGKTVIRGGYGIMNERVQGNDVYNNAGTVPLAASINFNSVILGSPNTSVAPLTGSTGDTIPFGTPVNNVTGLDKPNYASPRSTQFSLGVQQSIGRSVLSVAYVGTRNRHQSYNTEINLPDQSLLAAYVNGTNTAPYNAVVPYIGYHGIRMSRNESNGEYNGLQMSMRGSWFSNDLQYQFGYTYSHAYDSNTNGSSAGDLGTISNPYAGWSYDYGPSTYDRRNIFFANFVYDIPFMKHSDNKLAKTFIGGWEISGIITATSGAPINIVYNGHSVASVVPNTTNRPDQTGSGHDPHTIAEWFDTSIYAAPAAGAWGNAHPYSVYGPGRDNWNLSLFKNFVFSETRGSNLQFRAEFFNVWNHTQLWADSTGGISNNAAAGDFGKITRAYDPRTIQLALKLYF
jgi:hypothetical protein